MGMSTHRCLLVVLLALPSPAVAADHQAIPIVLGESTVALNGPWKFHGGDDSRWADPAFDDSGWESVDLTPSPGANDGDVGLSGYVPGWSAKGHPGYHGYAWYRIHLTVTPPAGKTLALLGPWAVDSVYQVYGNGTLLGGVGDFKGPTPVAHGSHYPRLLAFPPASASGGARRLRSGCGWAPGPRLLRVRAASMSLPRSANARPSPIGTICSGSRSSKGMRWTWCPRCCSSCSR